ncbi:MAG: NADH-quinone oxidoreductase subunit M [Chloroflexota bacterium]|nr:NADH-quinone oxidoreductase subunit M [Chloroflexota bacterium]
MFSSLWLLGVAALPLVAVVVLLIWRKATKLQAGVLAEVSEGLTLLIVFLLLPRLRQDGAVFYSFAWIQNLSINFSLELNWLSLVFLVTEMAVTLAAMVYSLGEKTGEKSSNYYYALLLLFSLGMSGTTLAEDVFVFYIFWELMLLASVLLILIWGHGEERGKVSLKYFIVTHLGSLIVLVGLITLYVNVGSSSLSVLMEQAESLPLQMQRTLTALFVIGFSVKMAIFPLHIWLPDAHTVAPTPVTIILAAAMLSMGTYGILRFPFSLFSMEALQPFSLWMMITGLISEVYGALMAFAEKDVKRIIAYSSVSQMGYILFGLGSLTEVGMQGAVMHVVYHAIVKGLLFMVVGIIIQATQERDIQKLGGLGKALPAVCLTAAVGALGISGMPPLGIFNSEWMIFSGGFETEFPAILTIGTLLGSIFTVIYALRFFGTIFLGDQRPDKLPKKASLALILPTVAVAVLLLLGGILPGPLLSWVVRGVQGVVGGL